MLLSQHHLLFTQRSLEEQLQQPFDDANCWLGSVEEAIETRIHHVDILRSEAAEFFPKKVKKCPPHPQKPSLWDQQPHTPPVTPLKL